MPKNDPFLGPQKWPKLRLFPDFLKTEHFKSTGTYKGLKILLILYKIIKIIIKDNKKKWQNSQNPETLKIGPGQAFTWGPQKWTKTPKTSYFRISRNGCLGAKAAPGTNRSRAGTANQEPQSHSVAKLSEEVRNHKPCESRVAQHYVTSSSRGAKKGRAGDACF